MKKRISKITALLLAASLLMGMMSAVSFAQTPDKLDPVTVTFDDAEPGAPEISKNKVLYQTFNPGDDPAEHIVKNIEVNGDVYTLRTADTPVLVKTEEVDPDTLELVSDAFMEGTENEHLPEEIIERDGKKFKEKSKKLDQTEAEEFTVHKKETEEITVEAAVDIRPTREATYTDRASHRIADTTLELTQKEEIASFWDDDFRFRIRITDYDAPAYVLGDSEIPNGADLNDYKALFLSELKLDPDFYTIESVTWDGEPFTENGHLFRYALASGKKLKKTFALTYEGDVTYPAVDGYRWLIEYEEIVPEETKTVYTMSTDVVFGLENPVMQDNRNFWQKLGDLLRGLIELIYEAAAEFIKKHPVISVSTLLLLTGFIIFLFMRKRDHVCLYDDKVKCKYRKVNKKTCENCMNYHKRQPI